MNKFYIYILLCAYYVCIIECNALNVNSGEGEGEAAAKPKPKISGKWRTYAGKYNPANKVWMYKHPYSPWNFPYDDNYYFHEYSGYTHGDSAGTSYYPPVGQLGLPPPMQPFMPEKSNDKEKHLSDHQDINDHKHTNINNRQHFTIEKCNNCNFS